MKRKLSLLLAMVLAMTMVMGISVAAFADITPGEGDILYLEDIAPGTVIHTDSLTMTTEARLTLRGGGNFKVFCDYGNPCGVTILREETYPNFYIFGRTFTIIDNPFYAPSKAEVTSKSHVHNFVYGTIIEPTMDHDGLVGEACSCGATRNTSVISAMDYAMNKYADQLIKAAKPGQKITLEFGEWNSFPRYVMAKISARMNENITFVFKFKQNKKMQTVTIEPGTAIDLQYDWYGPDKMKELYGAE